MRILFLSTWFPYPLSQGSKIRAYHLLRALAAQHEVTSLSFQDTPIQPAWREHVKQLCHRVEIVPCDPFAADRARKRMGWLSLWPSSVVASRCADMTERVQQIAADWQPDRIVALTFVTAPYALKILNVTRVVDVDNMMARMLREAYEQEPSFTGRARLWLAWWKFRRYEQWLFSQFDACLVVTERDRQRLAAMLGKTDGIGIVPNGVDTTHNRPHLATPKPNTLVYNGALTFQANYDAMGHFLREVFPLVLAQAPNTRLTITGRTDHVPLDHLPLNDHVTLSGYLDDVRPTVAQSWICVVPLLAGGGTRLKILEAMALGTPVVSTVKGAEGLEVVHGEHALIADTPGDFAAQIVRLMKEPTLREKLVCNARRLVEEKYGWAEIGQHFRDLVEGASQFDVARSRKR
jgi:glycosyltransferase involved in cell wall biosynthesis